MNKPSDDDEVSQNSLHNSEDDFEEELLESVFGSEDSNLIDLVKAPTGRKEFQPWHHPVKQLVRHYQWVGLTRRLVEKEREEDDRHTLRYFTLPGADLLDVRLIARELQVLKTKIDYFGFDSSQRVIDRDGKEDDREQTGIYFATESALRQSGLVADSSEILKDRLEDIAQSGTHASNRLQNKNVFDVINIDACNHLAYVPNGRTASLFDALDRLLLHQLSAKKTWLLFITTRADPQYLGDPVTHFKRAIDRNVADHGDNFGNPLADCIGCTFAELTEQLDNVWSKQDLSFLKLFCIGVGKYLLQFFHAQRNIPAEVELASVYTYKVHSDDPDMLSFAFRIRPLGLRSLTFGDEEMPKLELKKALQITQRTEKMWDLDAAIEQDASMKVRAVEGTRELLGAANYDLGEWKRWLESHTSRPLLVD